MARRTRDLPRRIHVARSERQGKEVADLRVKDGVKGGVKDGTRGVQALDRALDILEALAAHRQPMRLVELSHQLGLHKSTVHRLVSSLARRRYVERDPETGRYRLGLKVFELGSRLFNSMELRQEARPLLQELVNQTLETAHLGILDEGQVVYIEKVESPQTVRMYSELGKRAPAHCTAMGKVLLAHLPEEELDRIIAMRGLTRYTSNTIVEVDQLKDHLRRVAAQGYAVDDTEHEEAIRCVAAPVRNYRGEVVAALSVSGPAVRLTRERIEEVAQMVRATAMRISRRLGFDGEAA